MTNENSSMIYHSAHHMFLRNIGMESQVSGALTTLSNRTTITLGSDLRLIDMHIPAATYFKNMTKAIYIGS